LPAVDVGLNHVSFPRPSALARGPQLQPGIGRAANPPWQPVAVRMHENGSEVGVRGRKEGSAGRGGWRVEDSWGVEGEWRRHGGSS
jgi:hypothetical protein